MADKILSEKLRVDALRRIARSADERAYLSGYRIGLSTKSEDHAVLLGGAGSYDPLRVARGRGYRDGLRFMARNAQPMRKQRAQEGRA